MSGQPKTEPVPVGSVADLVAFARQGEKPRAEWRVGTEHEKIGIRLGDLRPVPYEGENGIEGVLAAVAAEGGWTEVREAGALIALEGASGSITLEPGGQLELSGAPWRSLADAKREIAEHFDAVRRESGPAGVAWLAAGYRPFGTRDQVPWMPKGRYEAMRRGGGPPGGRARGKIVI